MLQEQGRIKGVESPCDLEMTGGSNNYCSPSQQSGSSGESHLGQLQDPQSLGVGTRGAEKWTVPENHRDTELDPAPNNNGHLCQWQASHWQMGPSVRSPTE